MKENKYDNPSFFDQYEKMLRSQIGLEGAGEWHTLKNMLPDFQEKYFDMLKAGGSKHHKELLAPFGLDASDPKFWDKGLSMIAGFIDELEAMED